MSKKMYIDASHAEETRVVVVSKGQVEDFDFESQAKKSLRGNIYLARVTRVEPSLQAAFVEYGGNRHGFLAFSEIHPDYYQIPVSDRETLQQAADLEAELTAELDLIIAELEEAEQDTRTQRRSAATDTAIEYDPDDPFGEDREREDEGGESEPVEIARADAAAQPPISAAQAAEPAAELDNAEDGATDIEGTASDALANEVKSASRGPALFTTGADLPSLHSDLETPAFYSAEMSEDQAQTEFQVDLTEPEEPESPQSPNNEDSAEENQSSLTTFPAPAASEIPEDQVSTDDIEAADNTEGEAAIRAERDDIARGKSETNAQSRAREADIENRLKDARRERAALLRNYRIQEVIKRRQVLLIQVVKEERGNKGAAVTTYLSLAGRYGVLMPNTAKGGGISRKISNATDRRRLRKAVAELDVPKGIGLIIRTAGAKRTKSELKRDYDYLIRLWHNIRDLTIKSIAPSLIYEEASLIKRAIRDMYDKDTEAVKIEGEAGYREAKDFMKMLMPSHAKHIQSHKKASPLFLSDNVESQLDEMYQPIVKLQSGGYLVIQQTEALISIDVNSGRATAERNIEATALKTNLEAAQEVARQCRLRDLAGLVVIDFIDMEENRNNRAVEKKIKDAMKTDRARIQIGRISAFGLMELSRQRRRSGIVDGTTQLCPTCSGAGAIRSVEMAAMRIIRAIEADAVTGKAGLLTVKTSLNVAMFILNNKRAWLDRIESNNGVVIEITAGDIVADDVFEIEKKGTPRPVTKGLPAIQADLSSDNEDSPDEDDLGDPLEPPMPDRDADSEDTAPTTKRRKKRQRKGRGTNAETDVETGAAAQTEQISDEQKSREENAADGVKADDSERSRKRRRRGRRGGKKSRKVSEASDMPETDQPGREGQSVEEEGNPPKEAGVSLPEDNREDSRPLPVPIAARKRGPKPESEAAPSSVASNASTSVAEARAAVETKEIGDDQIRPSAPEAAQAQAQAHSDSATQTAPQDTAVVETVPPAPQSPEASPGLGAKKRNGWWQRALKIE